MTNVPVLRGTNGIKPTMLASLVVEASPMQMALSKEATHSALAWKNLSGTLLRPNASTTAATKPLLLAIL